LGWISIGLLAGAPVAPAQEGAPPAEASASLDDINKKLSNPVSNLWSITLQQNNFVLKYQLPRSLEDVATGNTRDGERWSSNLIFQPVLPVSITEEWNLITRPVIPLVVSQPHPERNDPLDIGRTTAFGDIALLQLLSPSDTLVGNWLLGLGPTWIFPSAGSDFTGQGKYQVGPAAVVGYLSEKWIAGALVQNWLSFAGDDDRDTTNGMNLQPFAAYFLRDGWSVGYSGNVLANWEASGDDVWTVPIGVSVSKVLKIGKLPLRVGLAGQYMPIHPDEFGQKWNIQVTLSPVLPKLIRGNLADPASLEFGLPKH
jgi:hypothetical protein